MTTPPATRRATTTISTSTFGGHGTTLGYDTEALSIAVGISSELAYDEPADDAATEEDESARKGDWYVNGDINVTSDRPRSTCRSSGTIKGDDSDPTVGPKTGFAAKITGNLGELSLSAGGERRRSVGRRHRHHAGQHRLRVGRRPGLRADRHHHDGCRVHLPHRQGRRERRGSQPESHRGDH